MRQTQAKALQSKEKGGGGMEGDGAGGKKGGEEWMERPTRKGGRVKGCRKAETRTEGGGIGRDIKVSLHISGYICV